MGEVSKFVIITMQRSGSNMLGTMLDSHPQIVCFGELMRKTPKWMLKQGYKGALKILEVLDEFKDDKVRFARPYDFVNAVFATEPRKPIRGFKLHIDQHPAFLEQLARDPEYAAVILQRENVLAQFSSGKIAEVTGQGTARKGDTIKKAKVKFSQREFGSFLKSVEKNYQWTRSLLAASAIPLFEIKYAQLKNQEKLRELVAFLGGDPEVSIEAATEKRNPSDILSRFVNPEEARQALVRMGHPEWADEQI